jgi:gas vesicle protein
MMGYIRGVIHGLVIGTVVGLCVAPQEGTKTREQLRGAVEKMREGLDQASGIVASIRERVTGHDEAAAGIELSGSAAPLGSDAEIWTGAPT